MPTAPPFPPGGRVAGASVLLLDHVGRRTGRERTTPLLFLDDGDDLVIVASRGGPRLHAV
jgi:deazaflavin-dependent oxidoreductase (nitroreductase family)